VAGDAPGGRRRTQCLFFSPACPSGVCPFVTEAEPAESRSQPKEHR
jgi:hypothetical protein